jgi:cobalt/nickel transport system permease protein
MAPLADVRLRIAMAFLLSLCVSLSTAPARLSIVAGLALLCAAWIYRGRMRVLLKRIVPANLLLLFLTALLAYDWQSGGLSAPGLQIGLLAFARANAAMLMCAALLSGLRPDQIAGAVTRLGGSKKFALLMFLMVRYLDEMANTRIRLERLLAARAFRFATDRHSYRTYGLMLSRLFLDGLDRATAVSQAMQARGYRGIFTAGEDRPVDRWQLLAAAALFAGLTLFLWWPL